MNPCIKINYNGGQGKCLLGFSLLYYVEKFIEMFLTLYTCEEWFFKKFWSVSEFKRSKFHENNF